MQRSTEQAKGYSLLHLGRVLSL